MSNNNDNNNNNNNNNKEEEPVVGVGEKNDKVNANEEDDYDNDNDDDDDDKDDLEAAKDDDKNNNDDDDNFDENDFFSSAFRSSLSFQNQHQPSLLSSSTSYFTTFLTPSNKNTKPPTIMHNNNNNNNNNINKENNEEDETKHDHDKRMEHIERLEIASMVASKCTMAKRSQWKMLDTMFKYTNKPRLLETEQETFQKILKEKPTLLLARTYHTQTSLPYGYMPLHVAAHNNNLDAVQILINVSKDVSMEYRVSCKDCTFLGETALHVATSVRTKKVNNIELIKFLVQWWIDETGVKPVGPNAPLTSKGYTPLGCAYHVYDNFGEHARPPPHILKEYEHILLAPGDKSVCLSIPGRVRSTTMMKRQPSSKSSFIITTPKSNNNNSSRTTTTSIGDRIQSTPPFMGLLLSSSKKKMTKINTTCIKDINNKNGAAGEEEEEEKKEETVVQQDLLCYNYNNIPKLNVLDSGGHYNNNMMMTMMDQPKPQRQHDNIDIMCFAAQIQGRRSTFEDSYNVICPLSQARLAINMMMDEPKEQQQQQQQEEQTTTFVTSANNAVVASTTNTTSTSSTSVTNHNNKTPMTNNITTTTKFINMNSIEEDCALLTVADGHGDDGCISRFVTDKLAMEFISSPAWNRLVKLLLLSADTDTTTTATSNTAVTTTTTIERTSLFDCIDRTNVCHSLIQQAFMETYYNIEHKLRYGTEQDDSMYFGGGGMNGEHGIRQVIGGSTCISALVTPNYIYVANLGDSRAIVISKMSTNTNTNDQQQQQQQQQQNNNHDYEQPHVVPYIKVTPLSSDHKPSLPNERARIERAGFQIEGLSETGEEITTTGYTYKSSTVNDDDKKEEGTSTTTTATNNNNNKYCDDDYYYIETKITNVTVPAGEGKIKFVDQYDEKCTVATSRSFGDFECKTNTKNLNYYNEQAIIAIPDMMVYERHSLHHDDMFLVVASDGLYDVMTNDEVGQFLYNKLYDLLSMTNHNSDGTTTTTTNSTNTTTTTTTTTTTSTVDDINNSSNNNNNNIHGRVTFDILDKLTHELLQECYHLGSKDNLTAIVCWLGGGGEDDVVVVPSSSPKLTTIKKNDNNDDSDRNNHDTKTIVSTNLTSKFDQEV